MSARPGPNDVMPCGTESARRRHITHGRTCAICGVGDEPLPAPAVEDAPALSHRERQVLELIATDLPYGAIGRRLGVTETTAKTHGRSLTHKLGASSRAGAVARAYQLGLLRSAA